MNSSFRCEVVADVADFAADVRPWLDDGPPSNQVISTLLEQRVSGVVTTEPGALWVKVLRDRALVGVVVQTPPRGLLLSELGEGATAAVVEAMLEFRPGVPAANGPKRTSDQFCALWAVKTGCTASVVFASRLHEVTEVMHPKRVDGRRRAATAGDRATVTGWLMDFARVAGHSEAPGLKQLAATYDARIAAGQPQWMWEVDGEPVSFALESPPAAGTVRVQAVYTPPQQRGKGYAGAHVAEISADILARPGIEHCTLYTDLSNPISNGMYRRIGYRPVADLVNYAFEYPTLDRRIDRSH